MILLRVLFVVLFAYSSLGTTPDFRAHDLKRLVHLRNKVDRLQLQQKTDRMKLEALQKSVEDLLANKNRVPSGQNAQRDQTSSPLLTQDSNFAEDVGLLRGQSGEEELKENAIVSTDAADHALQDELRRHVADLRKEVSVLKSSYAKLEAMHSPKSESSPRLQPDPVNSRTSSKAVQTHGNEANIAPYTSSSDENRRKEILWIEENWKRLQDLQEDLEEKCNVTVAMHVQQEVQSRLSGLDESVRVLQGTLSSAVARGAVADGRLSALSQEEVETKQALQKANAKLADLHNEVASLREDFNEVLSALPDGALNSGLYSEAQSAGNNTASLARSSLRKLQRSSVQLLEALDRLQLRHEADRTRLRQELAELEYNVTRTTQDQHETMELLRSNSDREALHEVDLNALTDHVKILGDSFNLLSLYQNDIDYRLGKIETSRLIIPSSSEPVSEVSPVVERSTGSRFDSVVSFLDHTKKNFARAKAGSKLKHRRRRNKRKYKFRT